MAPGPTIAGPWQGRPLRTTGLGCGGRLKTFRRPAGAGLGTRDKISPFPWGLTGREMHRSPSGRRRKPSTSLRRISGWMKEGWEAMSSLSHSRYSRW